MPNVYWSSKADAALSQLPETVQREVRRKEAYVRRYPEMYPLVHEGRHAGERRLVVAQRYHVYYKVYGDGQGCFITEISPARAAPE
jgi:hypothetical protein